LIFKSLVTFPFLAWYAAYSQFKRFCFCLSFSAISHYRHDIHAYWLYGLKMNCFLYTPFIMLLIGFLWEFVMRAWTHSGSIAFKEGIFLYDSTLLARCYSFLVNLNWSFSFNCSRSRELSKVESQMQEIPLDPKENKTGDIWHVCIEVFKWIISRVNEQICIF